MRIGMTTTIPVEIVLAAGHTPVDLNNIFILAPHSTRLVEEAENAGYPRNICGWIKGLYAVVTTQHPVDAVIAVTQGDCSNTHALMETFIMQNLPVIPFAYPFDQDYDLLKLQMEKLCRVLGTDWTAAVAEKKRLDQVRARVHEIDRLTWHEDRVSGFDNHLWQVSCSDFNGDAARFARDADDFLAQARQAPPRPAGEVRLAYIGVPPIFTDLYQYLEDHGARVVFNEVQRQFSMPDAPDDLVEQYRRYTYPYGAFARLTDITREIARRRVDGVIHYVQGFCYRQIEDLIFREKLDLPLLTLEGDRPGPLDARTKLRLDSFLEMLR